MRKYLTLLLSMALVVAGSVTPAAAHGSHNINITQASHRHPSGRDFSLFCLRFRAVPGHRVSVKAEGGSVDGRRTYRWKLQGEGTDPRIYDATWRILQPGSYKGHAALLIDGNAVNRDSVNYTVDGSKTGPYACPGTRGDDVPNDLQRRRR